MTSVIPQAKVDSPLRQLPRLNEHMSISDRIQTPAEMTAMTAMAAMAAMAAMTAMANRSPVTMKMRIMTPTSATQPWGPLVQPLF